MSLNVFILIVGIVLLVMVILSETAPLLAWLYQIDRRNKR